MAKLTNFQRDRLVQHIMADVPTIDYAEQMKARAIEICVGLMPAPVRRIWDNAELRGFLKHGHASHCCMILATPGFGNYDDQVRAAFAEDATLKAAHDAHDAQRDARKALSRSIYVSIYSCTTDKQFRERFPALAKYLPEPATAAANLPATSALIDSLRAAGLELAEAA